MDTITPPGASVACDSEFDSFQDRLWLELAKQFDAWAARASAAAGARENQTMRDYATNGALQSISSEMTLIYDLARLCSDFIVGDLWAWGCCLRRQGASVDAIIQRLHERAAQTSADMHQRWWKAGSLGVLGSVVAIDWSGKTGWVEETWMVVVEQWNPDFIENQLKPALQRPARTPIDQLPIECNRRKPIDDFVLRVYRETGEKITRMDIALLARYRSKTEIFQFQRCDRHLSKIAVAAFERVLNMKPTEAAAALPVLRAKSKQRERVQ